MKRTTLYILLCGWLLTTAAGCSVQKKCKSPDLEVPEEIVAGERDSLSISDRNWWEIYSDPTLCRLIERTLEHNRSLQSAEARVRQLEELYRVSKAARLPSVDGTAYANRETNDYADTKFSNDPEIGIKARLS